MHPYTTSAAHLGQPTSKMWAAGMSCPLAPSPFEEYYRKVQLGERQAGRVVSPVTFDLT